MCNVYVITAGPLSDHTDYTSDCLIFISFAANNCV